MTLLMSIEFIGAADIISASHAAVVDRYPAARQPKASIGNNPSSGQLIGRVR
jgi:hypothetical protein